MIPILEVSAKLILSNAGTGTNGMINAYAILNIINTINKHRTSHVILALSLASACPTPNANASDTNTMDRSNTCASTGTSAGVGANANTNASSDAKP